MAQLGKIPWRMEKLPTPVFWPGESHGLCSPWGRKELDTAERLSLSRVSCNLALPGASQVALVVKDLPVSVGDVRDEGLIPGSESYPGEGQWQPTPVFLPGESPGQRSLAGYSP